jgi:hypothetical protein
MSYASASQVTGIAGVHHHVQLVQVNVYYKSILYNEATSLFLTKAANKAPNSSIQALTHKISASLTRANDAPGRRSPKRKRTPPRPWILSS